MDLPIGTQQGFLPGLLAEHAAFPDQLHGLGQELVEALHSRPGSAARPVQPQHILRWRSSSFPGWSGNDADRLRWDRPHLENRTSGHSPHSVLCADCAGSPPGSSRGLICQRVSKHSETGSKGTWPLAEVQPNCSASTSRKAAEIDQAQEQVEIIQFVPAVRVFQFRPAQILVAGAIAQFG